MESVSKKGPPDSDMEILNDVRDRIYEKIKTKVVEMKVRDLLRVIELKNRLAASSVAEKKFWEMIGLIRLEELSGKVTGRRKDRAGSKGEKAALPGGGEEGKGI